MYRRLADAVLHLSQLYGAGRRSSTSCLRQLASLESGAANKCDRDLSKKEGGKQNRAANCADFSRVTLVLGDDECSVLYRRSPSRHVLHSDIGVKERRRLSPTAPVSWEMKTRMWISSKETEEAVGKAGRIGERKREALHLYIQLLICGGVPVNQGQALGQHIGPRLLESLRLPGS